MPLPALPVEADARTNSERTNVLIRDYNRTDAFKTIYAADTGSATAYAIAPIPGIEVYTIGQPFEFKATNTNTSTAPTLNVNGLGAGTITYPDGSALVAGDIAANGYYTVITASMTPTFHLQTPRASVPINNSGTTTFLTGDVTIVSSGTFVNGPDTGSIGDNGQTWLIMAQAVFSVGGGGGQVTLRIHNGTADIGSVNMNVPNSSFGALATSVVAALTGATTFTLQGTDNIGGSASSIKATATNGATNKATAITAVRLA